MRNNLRKLLEDITAGYAPKEITFGGYTTKNLHHSEDAARAFQQTIQRVGESHPRQVVNALKATDNYMGINDVHLERDKVPDEAELQYWIYNHSAARALLESLGEFLHHMDYWHAHKHELENMETNYNPQSAGADMSESTKIKASKVESPVVNPDSKFNIAKSIMSFKDFMKLDAMARGQVPKQEQDLNDIEADDMTAVGGLTYPPSKMNTNSRIQRIRQQLGD